jgi:hypothetical protein
LKPGNYNRLLQAAPDSGKQCHERSQQRQHQQQLQPPHNAAAACYSLSSYSVHHATATVLLFNMTSQQAQLTGLLACWLVHLG